MRPNKTDAWGTSLRADTTETGHSARLSAKLALIDTLGMRLRVLASARRREAVAR